VQSDRSVCLGLSTVVFVVCVVVHAQPAAGQGQGPAGPAGNPQAPAQPGQPGGPSPPAGAQPGPASSELKIMHLQPAATSDWVNVALNHTGDAIILAFKDAVAEGLLKDPGGASNYEIKTLQIR